MSAKYASLLTASLLTTALNSPAADNADQGDIEALEPMVVVADSPVSASGMAAEKRPTPVQTVTSQKLEQSQSINITDYMRRYLGGVTVNDAQNNPYQPDVQYRGFTASPLLGLPQGLSVYYNGVRFNEPFGDTVNWDLIPQGAVEQMSLYGGSNPVYGLNSLGGALSIRTKTGFSAPGHYLEALGGSWGRHSQEVKSGWNNGTFGYFLDLKSFEENGWRQFSPSDVKQAFGVFSWRDGERSGLNLTLASTNNRLIGNGALPIQLYQENRKAVFTHPDRTANRLFLASLDGNARLTDRIELSGIAYFRQNRSFTLNGDDTDYDECLNDPARVCDDEGEGEEALGVDGRFIPFSGAVDGATRNASATRQRGYGGSLQTAFTQPIFGLNNRLALGGTYDEARIHFGADTELASLTADRGALGSGYLVNDSRVRLRARNRHYGLYLSDTLSLTDALNVTLAGRYNLSFIGMDDRYVTDPTKTLDGFHKFERFNPSAGLSWQFLREIGVYGNYSESNRAPTPMELSCADPEAPCKLPNAFLADPHLNQVVAKTWEAGFRGDLDLWVNGDLQWRAGLFQTENHDDILFIASGNVTNQGYFSNVGVTRRRGIELGLDGKVFDRLRFSFNYALLDATFRTPFLATSPNNPHADANGQIQVEKRDRIPGLPRHSLKFSSDLAITNRISVGMDMIFNSGQYLRGDEANSDKPLKEYAVFNLHGEYRVNNYLSIFGRVDNLFDKRYNSFGLYGDASDALGDAYGNARFVGVSAPRAGWGGIRLALE
jgi:outer membrane receptor protein involved in Fe transport